MASGWPPGRLVYLVIAAFILAGYSATADLLDVRIVERSTEEEEAKVREAERELAERPPPPGSPAAAPGVPGAPARERPGWFRRR